MNFFVFRCGPNLRLTYVVLNQYCTTSMRIRNDSLFPPPSSFQLPSSKQRLSTMLVGTKKLAIAIFGLLLAACSVHADGGGLRILAADTEGREEIFGDIDAVQRRLRRLGTGDDESSSSSASSSSKGSSSSSKGSSSSSKGSSSSSKGSSSKSSKSKSSKSSSSSKVSSFMHHAYGMSSCMHHHSHL